MLTEFHKGRICKIISFYIFFEDAVATKVDRAIQPILQEHVQQVHRDACTYILNLVKSQLARTTKTGANLESTGHYRIDLYKICTGRCENRVQEESKFDAACA